MFKQFIKINFQRLSKFKSILIMPIVFLLIFFILIIFAQKSELSDFDENKLYNDNISNESLLTTDSYNRKSKEEYESEKVLETEPPKTVTLKEYLGKVGIYSEQGELWDIVDVRVAVLSEKDRRDLSVGIVIPFEDLFFAVESLES